MPDLRTVPLLTGAPITAQDTTCGGTRRGRLGVVRSPSYAKRSRAQGAGVPIEIMLTARDGNLLSNLRKPGSTKVLDRLGILSLPSRPCRRAEQSVGPASSGLRSKSIELEGEPVA